MSSGIKSFVSEKQLEEKRKTRQEEWERVRKPEDPVELPEVEYDPRSLYERLKEQKDKKQEDFEEQLKFKNHFRGINEEESEFLSDVCQITNEFEKKKRDEEKRELDDFKMAIEQARELPEVGLSLPEQKEEKPPTRKVQTVRKTPQQNILKNAVKRKAPSSEAEKPPGTETSSSKDAVKVAKINPNVRAVVYPSATKCIGILPGLSAYDGDDSSEEDTDDDSSSSDDSVPISDNLLSSIVYQ